MQNFFFIKNLKIFIFQRLISSCGNTALHVHILYFETFPLTFSQYNQARR